MMIYNHPFIHDNIIYKKQRLESNNYSYNHKGVGSFDPTHQSNVRIFLWLDSAFEKSFPDSFQLIISQNFKGDFSLGSTEPFGPIGKKLSLIRPSIPSLSYSKFSLLSCEIRFSWLPCSSWWRSEPTSFRLDFSWSFFSSIDEGVFII